MENKSLGYVIGEWLGKNMPLWGGIFIILFALGVAIIWFMIAYNFYKSCEAQNYPRAQTWLLLGILLTLMFKK